MDNLEGKLKDIPASNIVNYDVINLSDDPGSLKVVPKRDVKRVDQKIDSSKTSISITMLLKEGVDRWQPISLHVI